ncbi:putative carboxylesterase [Abeliophyllum distichum]|uniref:Carboxylesterase n=1 Tax=Abeliophyllum distichum TaxID=126358 RepID=A0ABD1Q5B1_9LAMI
MALLRDSSAHPTSHRLRRTPPPVYPPKTNISPVVQARLYLPKLTDPHQKLPVLVYYHGGGFCVESAFSFLDQRYMNILAAEAKALIVSVEYRLAPEHPLPVAYEDSWTALQWVASHVIEKPCMEKELWLT